MDEQTVVTTTHTQMLAIRKARADPIDAGILITTFVGASHAMTLNLNSWRNSPEEPEGM